MQTKDLLVTGDVKILGTLYAKGGIGGGGSGSSDTSGLQSSINNLNTDLRNHKSSGDHDTRYDAKNSASTVQNNLNTHKSSGDHDTRYYTEQEINDKVTTLNGSISSVSSTLGTHTAASNPHSDSMAKTNPTGTGIFHFGHQHSFNTSAGVTHGYAFGGCNSITGDYGVAMGNYVIASTNQLAIGHYSKSGLGSLTGTSGTAFVIGNGASGSQGQALRVSYAGDLYTAKGTINSGADYAEYFEWKDQNVLNEDRRGYFVTLEENKIKIAQSKDYILGVISGQPSVIGNGDEDWQGRFVKDDFGAYIEEHFEYEIEELDEVTNQIVKKKESGTKWKENPEYDATKEYIQRADRPEWDAVGMLGVLSVRDDGTCEVNGYCGVADGGIATKAETGYRVIERVNDHIVKIVFR